MNYYDIKITGKDVKRFIKNLNKMHINIYNIEYSKKSAVIRVNRKDYLIIKKIKTIYDIEIVNYYGLSKLFYIINTYKILFIFLLIGFIFFIMLTNIIFDVEVKHDNKELRELVLNELKEYKISKYNLCVSYKKKEEIKNDILDKYHDRIEWLEIKRIGTKYLVLLEERKENNSNIDNTPRNIIAKKNGMVTKIISDSGEINVKVNQYVKKGDILISGYIHKNEDIVGLVKANGNVFAEVWYTVKVELPYHYYEEKSTGNKSKIININFLNHKYNFKFSNYDYSNNKTIFSIKNNILPISISLLDSYEINVNDSVNTFDYALIKANEIAQDKLKDKLGKNIQIIYEKNLKLYEINSKIIVVMFYKVIEEIGEYSNISSS